LRKSPQHADADSIARYTVDNAGVSGETIDQGEPHQQGKRRGLGRHGQKPADLRRRTVEGVRHQKWNGTTDSLKQNPTITITKASASVTVAVRDRDRALIRKEKRDWM